MRVPLFRRLSHAPSLRALLLLAWLAMASVPAVASAKVFAMSGPTGASGMHAPGAMGAGDCCPSHHGQGQASAQCEACAASATGMPVPALFSLMPVPGHDAAWPVHGARPVARPPLPPLRPPRA